MRTPAWLVDFYQADSCIREHMGSICQFRQGCSLDRPISVPGKNPFWIGCLDPPDAVVEHSPILGQITLDVSLAGRRKQITHERITTIEEESA